MSSDMIHDCCVQGSLHDGHPTGHISKSFIATQYGDVAAYISPAGGVARTQYGLLLLPDFFGYDATNTKLLADKFAQAGYTVVAVDLFYGDNVDPVKFMNGEIDSSRWLRGGYSDREIAHVPEVIDPIITASLEKMQQVMGLKEIGVLGYCFGAKYAIRSIQSTLDIVRAAYIAHPAFTTDEEFAGIKHPLSIAAAEKDLVFTESNRQRTQKILSEVAAPWQISLYGAMNHGFAIRGDRNVDKERLAMDAAFAQAQAWFKLHITQEDEEAALNDPEV